MPLLQMPETDNDGGYAVSDYTRVDSRLGTMADPVSYTHLHHLQRSLLCHLPNREKSGNR